MLNFEKCAYTYRHRRAIQYLVEKLIKDEDLQKLMQQRASTHDLDKLVMYQVLDYFEAHQIHTQISSHHMQNQLPKSYLDYLEAILDYESAGYTKPDKPLNAYDFILKMKTVGKFSDELSDNLLKICEDLGINYSYSVTADEDGMKYLEQFQNVSEDMIVEELRNYFKGTI